MSDLDLYRDHLSTLDGVLADSLERAGRSGLPTDGVLLHAGRERTYHADDQPVAFRSTPHFRRWIPLDGPEHVVLLRPGRTPRLVRVRPRDFWVDTTPPPAAYWEPAVEVEEVESFAEVPAVLDAELGDPARLAYIGPAPEAATEVGIPPERVEPDAVLRPLDWYRALKTPWEVSRIRLAASRAADGHRAARDAFLADNTERQVHWAYLEGAGHLEMEVPFETIIAFDAKAAILHYQHKRGPEAAPGKVLLCDAGATCEGYASDVTRTWVHPGSDGLDDLFAELVRGMDRIERRLVDGVRPGRPYPEIHREAHRLLADLLAETGLLTGSPEEAFERGVTRSFLPHGVGHHMGLQVHDVGGRQASPDGGTVDPPEEYPALRTTRRLEPGQVVTIEPGLYFIEMLLDPLRETEEGKLVAWDVVDRLADHGGIRIEDDVLCTEDGSEDLSRPLLEGP